MARKPLNPDNASGNARLGIGRGSNAGRSQKSGVNAKAIQAKTASSIDPKGVFPKSTIERMKKSGMNDSQIKKFLFGPYKPLTSSEKSLASKYRASLGSKETRVSELEKKLNLNSFTFPKRKGQ
jgi:hypothetical protein